MKPTESEIKACLELLQRLNTDGALVESLTEEQRVSLMREAGRLSRPNRTDLRVRNRQIKRERRRQIVRADKSARASTGIREARKQTVFKAPERLVQASLGAGEDATLRQERSCYVCKSRFQTVHHFYDSMCTPCGDLNYQKRFQTAPLDGQVAIITGSRLKIGYQSALMMLRSGARVIATTRFPVDAALRFSREDDFSKWGSRLQIYGLDLRHTPSVELFCAHMEKTLDRLDILVNNAAQTVRRPTGFYAHLMENERKSLGELPAEAASLLISHSECLRQLGLSPAEAASSILPAGWERPAPGVGLAASAELSQIPYSYDRELIDKEVFPEGKVDADLQQVDLRKKNSWRLTLAEVPSGEMLEVQLVNSIAPFVLCSRLAPLMRRDRTGRKHIVNVSAMEGKFSRYTKTDKHPHTNMAKAALNMMTLTSAPDLLKDGIHMNAVDTGWVTDEDPMDLSLQKKAMHDFEPPLDIVDGAARVCDPFFHGILTGEHWSGKFLKDYFPTEW